MKIRHQVAALAAGISLLFSLGGDIQAQQMPNFDKVEIETVPVQGNVFMLVGAGGNISVQAGSDGLLLVDTQYAQLAPKILTSIRKLSDKPILWIVNTHIDADHTGGNDALSKLANVATGQRPRIVAQANVLDRMSSVPESDPSRPPEGVWPNDEYSTPQKDFSFNGESIVIYHMPSAHTDGDSIVFFRSSNVLSVGDIFTPDRYPFIDIQRGGSVQGMIDALNQILTITVPLKYQEGGTYVVPGHGRLCDEADVVEFRDMLTIVRDRVRDMIKKGMTLEQVRAARPTRDYDTEYAVTPGAVTIDSFVEAVYKSLNPKK